jgi:hypothetical protein
MYRGNAPGVLAEDLKKGSYFPPLGTLGRGTRTEIPAQPLDFPRPAGLEVPGTRKYGIPEVYPTCRSVLGRSGTAVAAITPRLRGAACASGR